MGCTVAAEAARARESTPPPLPMDRLGTLPAVMGIWGLVATGFLFRWRLRGWAAIRFRARMWLGLAGAAILAVAADRRSAQLPVVEFTQRTGPFPRDHERGL